MENIQNKKERLRLFGKGKIANKILDISIQTQI